MKRLFLAFALVALLAYGCAKAPQYEVDSLEELKSTFSNNQNILFPNIDIYGTPVFEQYIVYRGGESSGCSRESAITGYSVRLGFGRNTQHDRIEGVSFSCLDGSVKISGQSSENQDIDPNMKYRNIDVTNYSQEIIYEQSSNPYKDIDPEGTFYYSYGYSLNYLGNEYTVDGLMVLPPDEVAKTDKNTAIEKGEQKLFELFDSVIEQKG